MSIEAKQALEGILKALTIGHVAVAVHGPPPSTKDKDGQMPFAGISIGTAQMINTRVGYIATIGVSRETLVRMRQEISELLGEAPS